MSELKLNNKRTILVGLAFLSISAFWQMYDNLVPLILRETFHMDESLTGMIMAADNILALFLLPFFGGLSDRTNTKLGRRTPYILAGTAGAVVLYRQAFDLWEKYRPGGEIALPQMAGAATLAATLMMTLTRVSVAGEYSLGRVLCVPIVLIAAWRGDWENGLFFCGANVGRMDRMSTVEEQIHQIITEWRAAQ